MRNTLLIETDASLASVGVVGRVDTFGFGFVAFAAGTFAFFVSFRHYDDYG